MYSVHETLKIVFTAFRRARFDMKLLSSTQRQESASIFCPPVHSDHLSIEDVPEDLFHRDLSSVAGAPAQSVGEVVPSAQGQDGHSGDKLVLALRGGGEREDQQDVFHRLHLYSG